MGKRSATRSGLRVATYEGITAIIVAQLLGGPYLTGYLIHLGAGSGQIGFVLAIPTWANILTLFTALHIQKIHSRRKYVMVVAGSFRLVWLLTGLIPFLLPKDWWISSYVGLYMAAFALNAMASVPWTSLISDMVPARVRGRYFGIRNTIHWGVGCLALIVGGWLLERYPGDLGFAILYGISAVAVVINIVQLYMYPDLPFEKSEESSDKAMLLKPLKDKTYFRATMFLSVWIFLQNTVVPLFSYVMLDVLKLSYFPHVSVITTVQNIAMMIAFYMWGNLNAKVPTQKLMLLTMPILAISCILWLGVAWIPAFAALLIVHVVLGIGMGGFNLLAFNFVIGDTPKSERPMYFAVYAAITGFAGFLGPTFGGQLFRWLKDSPQWIQSYGVNALAGVLMLALAIFVAPRFLGTQNRPKTKRGGFFRTRNAAPSDVSRSA
jgi:MFS family permease